MMSEIVSILILTYLVFILIPLRKAFLPVDSGRKAYFFTGKRIEYFDFLKGVAVVGVILIHISYLSLDFFKEANTLFIFELNNLTRFAIPFFLILSGILSTLKYEKKMDLGRYYWSKFLKIYLPFVFFTILAIYLHNKDIHNLLEYLINGRVLTPYYFIILILQFYILFPFLKYFKDSKIFLIFSFLISLSFFLLNINFISTVIIFPKFLFFFVYGMYYRNYFVNYKKDKSSAKPWLFIIFIYLLISVLLPAHYYNFRPFFGLAVFNLLFVCKDSIIKKLGNVYKFVCEAGKNSLWIYFTHFSILTGLFYLTGLFTKNLYLTVAVIFVISVPVCFVVGRLIAVLYNNVLNIKYETRKTR